MSLLDYERQFSKLRMNVRGEHKSPHKVAMMLAVIDCVESGEIADNQIFFSQPLRQRFSQHLSSLADPEDRDRPHLPFFHLRSEDFWHHHIKPGKRAEYSTLSTASGPGVVERCIQYAYLDDELSELLGNSVVSELLRAALLTNLEETDWREILGKANGWDWLECELIVKDYLEMLSKHLRSEPYSKAEHRKALLPKLNGRSNGAIEFKHQNISAVLLEIGLPYIPGYKPAFNYQGQLKQVVLAHLARSPADFDELSSGAGEESGAIKHAEPDWANVFDPNPPERLINITPPQRQYLASKTNFSELERLNRALGERGEQFVLDFERYRLEAKGRPDLAKEVEWSSKVKGDGLGYDIRSFDPDYESELFLEVKTTNSGKYQPFMITENERAFSNDSAARYRLYRIYEFRDQPRLFILPGAVEQYATLLPQNYRAVFGK